MLGQTELDSSPHVILLALSLPVSEHVPWPTDRHRCNCACLLYLSRKFWECHIRKCFPGGSAGKESTRSVGDLGSIPGLGRSPGEGKGYPLQHSGLENSMECIVHGVAKSQTRLTFALTFNTSKRNEIARDAVSTHPGEEPVPCGLPTVTLGVKLTVTPSAVTLAVSGLGVVTTLHLTKFSCENSRKLRPG